MSLDTSAFPRVRRSTIIARKKSHGESRDYQSYTDTRNCSRNIESAKTSLFFLSHPFSISILDTLEQTLTGFPRVAWARMNEEFLLLIVVYDAELPFFRFLRIY